jgi:hypothetical protein
MDIYDPTKPHPFAQHRRPSRAWADADYWERTIPVGCTHCGASERNPRLHTHPEADHD